MYDIIFFGVTQMTYIIEETHVNFGSLSFPYLKLTLTSNDKSILIAYKSLVYFMVFLTFDPYLDCVTLLK